MARILVSVENKFSRTIRGKNDFHRTIRKIHLTHQLISIPRSLREAQPATLVVRFRNDKLPACHISVVTSWQLVITHPKSNW